MTRYRRLVPPGSSVHVIARFVDNAFRLRAAKERSEYLRRLVVSLEKSSWRLLAYALMSSHVHLAFVSGRESFASWSRPLHSSFATWLNRRQKKRGPLFAERPATILVPVEHVSRLIAYIHNNPVRAGLIASAESCDWSSHRAYIGLEEPPVGLNVADGLRLCGFAPDKKGRAAFSSFVTGAASETRDPLLSGARLRELRNMARSNLGSPVEIAYPEVDPEKGRETVPIVGLEGQVLRPKWNGTVGEVVALVASQTGIPRFRIESTSRKRPVCAARRLIIAIAHGHCGFTLQSAAASVGINVSAASKLWANASLSERAHARRLASRLKET